MTSLEGFRRGNDRDAARRAETVDRPGPSGQQDPEVDDVDLDALIAHRRSSVTPSPVRPAGEHERLGHSSPGSPAVKDHPATAMPSRRPASLPSRPAPPGPSPKTVRSMNVPTEIMVGLRVLAAVRNTDHPELVMTAVNKHAASIPPAVEAIKRRRRLQTAKLLVKLTDEQTELIDRLAGDRLMTRSSFITAVLDEFVPIEVRGEH